MSKRNNISYIKPRDPTFLANLKAQIGFSEGPNVDTKKQALNDIGSGSGSEEEREDEKPQIVVVRSGDLSAEEVAAAQKEAAEAPADLNQPIVFRKRHIPKEDLENPSKSSAKDSTGSKKKKKRADKITSSAKLSFNIEDDEDQDVE